jgi:iron complex transport system substrate-binding protein
LFYPDKNRKKKNMRLRILILTTFVLIVLVINGCGGYTTPAASATTTQTMLASQTAAVTSSTTPSAPTIQFPFTFKDDAGRSVTLPALPQRIVSLSPSNTEIVFALGLGDRLVGNTTYCNYPEAAKTVTKVGGFSDVDIEKVVSVKPDLILAANIHVAKVLPSLQQLGIPIMVVVPINLEGIYKDITLIGGLTGQARNAATLVADLRQRAAAVSAKTAAYKGDKPRVMYVTWHEPLYTAGDNTMTGELIKLAGGDNIAKDVDGYGTITLESVVSRNPQLIIVMSSMGSKKSFDFINTEPRLQSTDAMKNQRVFQVDSDLFGRTTPRIVDALEQMAKLVHPDLFK